MHLDVMTNLWVCVLGLGTIAVFVSSVLTVPQPATAKGLRPGRTRAATIQVPAELRFEEETHESRHTQERAAR